jgi:hypothetical protein
MAKPVLTATAIRADIVTRLKAANTPAGQRVYNSRTTAFEPSELPAIVVFSIGGSDSRWPMSGLVCKHTEQIQVTGFVTNADESALASALDAMSDAINDSLLADVEWLSAFETIGGMRTEKWQPDTQARFPLMAVTCTFEPTYSVQYTMSAASVPFERAAIDTEPGNPEGSNVSARLVELEQEA